MPELGSRPWPAVRSLSAPLTVCGVERSWFILSITVSACTMNVFKSFFGALVLLATLYGLGLLSTWRDPQMLRIVFNSSRYRGRYDPGKLAARPACVEVLP